MSEANNPEMSLHWIPAFAGMTIKELNRGSLIFGYIFVVIACAVYNLFYRFIGGLEFETEDKNV